MVTITLGKQTPSIVTIEQLRQQSSLDLSEGENVVVDGGYQNGDGAGGLFTWVSGSRVDDNGTVVIRPANLGPLEAGRWILLGPNTGGDGAATFAERAQEFSVDAAGSALSAELAASAAIAALESFPNYYKGDKGDPGGNAMSVGLFTDIQNISIPLGVDLIGTSGHHIVGVGPANYARVAGDPGLPGAWQTQDDDGNWWKLVVPGYVLAEWFGCVADATVPAFYNYQPNYTASLPAPIGVTDNLPLLKQAWLGLGKTTGPDRSSLIPIVFKQTDSTKCYFFSNTIIPPFPVRIEGTSDGLLQVGMGTMFLFPPNTPAVRCNHWSQQVLDGNAPSIGAGYFGTLIAKGIWFQGGGGTSDTAHGVKMRTLSSFVDCVIDGFSGRAVDNVCYTNVPLGSETFGLSIGSRWDNVSIRQCRRDGWYTEGSDVSASSFRGLIIQTCGLAAFVDIGFFNNDYAGLQIAAHGQRGMGGVYYAGRGYALIDDTVGIGGITTPGTNDDVWHDVGLTLVGPIATRYPQWVSGGDYQLSLPVLLGGMSEVTCYFEDYYLPAHTRVYGLLFCGIQSTTRTSSALRAEFTRDALQSAKAFLYHRTYEPVSPLNGAYFQSRLGGRPIDTDNVIHRWERPAEFGMGFGWTFGQQGRDYSLCFAPGTFSETYKITGYDTQETLGRAAGQFMQRYFVGVRFALGGSGGNRAMFTTNGEPVGTNRAAGERGFDVGSGLGGVDCWRGMGDGTVAPVGIIGAIQATGITSSSTLPEVIAALKAAKLAA